jgi:hypothetical protein
LQQPVAKLKTDENPGLIKVPQPVAKLSTIEPLKDLQQLVADQ